MSKTEKTLSKMRDNPRDWQIADLELIADRFRVTIRKGKGSHVTFGHPNWTEILTVPAHRPIKPIYIKKFVMLINSLLTEDL